MAYGQIYARPLPPVERMGRMKELIREPDEAPYIGGLDALKAAKLLREAQTPTVYTPRSLSEAATQARLPVPERQEQQVPQQRQVITEEDERILTAQAGGRAAIPQQIENLASKGRHGDTMLMHVNPDELKGLSSLLGPTTTNPDTGLPEAFLWWLPLIGAAVGGVGAAATGHDWKKGMLMGGLAGLGGAFAAPALGLGGGAAGAAVAPTAGMAGTSALAPAVGTLAPYAGTGIPAAAGAFGPLVQPMAAGLTQSAIPGIAAAGAGASQQALTGAQLLAQGGARNVPTTWFKREIAQPLRNWWNFSGQEGTGITPSVKDPKTGASTLHRTSDVISGTEGDQAVQGGAKTDVLEKESGFLPWWKSLSPLQQGLGVAGGAGLLGLAAQPPQQQIADLPVRKVSEFTFEEDDDKDPRIPKTFTQAELEEAVEAGPVPRFFAKEGGIVSLNIGGAPTGGGPGGRASTGHYGEVGPIGVNTYNPYTAHYMSTPDRRGEGGYEAPVVPPFEFPEVTPFRSNLATSNIQDRLQQIGGQLPPVTVIPQEVPVPAIPTSDIQGTSAMEDLFSRFKQRQGDPIIDLVASTEAVPVQKGGLLGLAVGGIPNIFEGHVQGVGDGMSDQIPFNVVPQTPADIPKAPDMAVLSTDEYVFPADAVSMLGNGSSDAGAKILDNAVKSVRRASIGTPKQITEIDGQKVLGGALTT